MFSVDIYVSFKSLLFEHYYFVILTYTYRRGTGWCRCRANRFFIIVWQLDRWHPGWASGQKAAIMNRAGGRCWSLLGSIVFPTWQCVKKKKKDNVRSFLNIGLSFWDMIFRHKQLKKLQWTVIWKLTISILKAFHLHINAKMLSYIWVQIF